MSHKMIKWVKQDFINKNQWYKPKKLNPNMPINVRHRTQKAICMLWVHTSEYGGKKN